MTKRHMRIIRCALLAAALLVMPGLAAAQAPSWPTRPIRVIIPQPPGGVLDTLIRSLGEPLQARLGQPLVVENRPGGNNAIGLEACANAAPDGYTLCAVSIEVMSILPHAEPELYRRWASLQPVTLIARNAGVLLVNPAVPVDDLTGFVRWARGRTDLNYGSSGEGSAANLIYEWLNRRDGLQLTHVPYRGIIDAFNELAAGRVQASYIALGFALQHIQAGRVKPIAVLGARRSPHLPNVPSLGELGYEFAYDGPWWGFAAPARTLQPILDRFARSVHDAVRDPEYRARFLDPQAYEGVGNTPAEFAAVIAAEREKGAAIVRAVGAR
jgi:tripartite-type tricarboxylate transporter receptor subunit TctC